MEHAFIDWLKTKTPTNVDPRIILGVGDDAAIVDFQSCASVISTDMLADGVHFILGQTPLGLIGRKSMAVNLSDIAAMGAKPVCAVVSLMLPKSMSMKQTQSITDGIFKLADEFNVSIVGGDTNRWHGPLVINVAVMGVLEERATAVESWRINGAQVGDVILVSGDFGNSIKQKHLTFTPRVDLALFLRNHYSVNAATDITDSLAIDLGAIAEQSQLGMELATSAIPISTDAQQQHHPDRAAMLNAALYDGEDFELAVVVDAQTAKQILDDSKLPNTMTAIGKMTDDQRFSLIDRLGNRSALAVKGYEH